jgi:hypothetical protein
VIKTNAKAILVAVMTLAGIASCSVALFDMHNEDGTFPVK